MGANVIPVSVTVALLLSCTAALAAGETTEMPLSVKEDAGKLYVGYDSHSIRVFDSTTLELSATFPAVRRYAFSIETDRDNIYYGTSTDTATAKLVALSKDGSVIASAEGLNMFLSIAANGGRLYDCQWDGVAEVRSLPSLDVLLSANISGFCGAMLVDDRHFYSTSEGRIAVFDKRNLSDVTLINAHRARIRSLWDDSSNLYSVSDDDTLKVWNKTDLSLIKSISIRNPWAMTGYGNYLYVTSDEKIMVLNKSGDTITTMNNGGPSVHALYATYGALYAAHGDGTVRIWDARTLQNTVTSQTFQNTPEKYQQMSLIQTVSYALLAVSVTGLAYLFYRNRKRKASATVVPAKPPTNPGELPPTQPQQ